MSACPSKVADKMTPSNGPCRPSQLQHAPAKSAHAILFQIFLLAVIAAMAWVLIFGGLRSKGLMKHLLESREGFAKPREVLFYRLDQVRISS